MDPEIANNDPSDQLDPTIAEFMHRAEPPKFSRIGVIVDGKMFKFTGVFDRGAHPNIPLMKVKLPLSFVIRCDFIVDFDTGRVIKSRWQDKETNTALMFTVNALGKELGTLAPNR